MYVSKLATEEEKQSHLTNFCVKILILIYSLDFKSVYIHLRISSEYDIREKYLGNKSFKTFRYYDSIVRL